MGRFVLRRDESCLNNPADTGVAQLVEHWSPKPGVGSSSLSTRAKIQGLDEKVF